MTTRCKESTKTFVQAEPDHLTPGGAAEVRVLLRTTTGEMTHVMKPPDRVSRPGYLDLGSQWLYVISGQGRIWDGSTKRIIQLQPGRCVYIPPGCPYQYCSDGTWLELIDAVVPGRSRGQHHQLTTGEWEPTFPGDKTSFTETAPKEAGPMEVYDRKYAPTHIAPDGSLIWELGEDPTGGLAICELPPGKSSSPVWHRSVEEIWHVMQGHGEIYQQTPSGESRVSPLRPSTSVYIAPQETFQFRNTSLAPLVMLLLTTPAWPGTAEAVSANEYRKWL